MFEGTGYIKHLTSRFAQTFLTNHQNAEFSYLYKILTVITETFIAGVNAAFIKRMVL